MKYFILIFFLGFFFMHCRHRNDKSKAVLPRDNSITIKNAYSDLFLDSLKMEDFLKTAIKSDSIRLYIRNFYNSRNFAFAWFNKDGLTVQAEGFWNNYNRYVKSLSDSSMYNRYLHTAIDTLLYEDGITGFNQDSLSIIELRLTRLFFYYVKAVYGLKADPEVMEWHIPRRKLKTSALLDSFISVKNDEWRPLSNRFYWLLNAVIQYNEIKKSGGWPFIDLPLQKVKKGDRNKLVVMVKKRLSVTHDYFPGDTSSLFNDPLLTAIKRAQQQFGLAPSNSINADLIKELNVPVEERLKQMLINLERMKWMPERPLNFISVNIPEYRFRVYENNNEVLGMDVVVGKAASRTVIFSDELTFIVFSPYWNVPRSIVRKEIYPAMKRDHSYLRTHNMEVTGYNDSLPIVRQKPGKGNALGQVKFIFPNAYNIYFHDTPAKSLFGRQKRAFSHGCIRLQKPFELARYLLRNDPIWTAAAIKEAMNKRVEKWVKLAHPLPVFITYFTSWAEPDGMVCFREDIYGHDKKMSAHMFE